MSHKITVFRGDDAACDEVQLGIGAGEVQIFTSKQQRRTSRTDMYCLGTALIQEFGRFAELGAADDGIVD